MFPPLMLGSELRIALAVGTLADVISRSLESTFVIELSPLPYCHHGDKSKSRMSPDSMRNMRDDGSEACPDEPG